MKHLHEYQQRVVDEKEELDERLVKLNAFIGTRIETVPEPERSRLIRQRDVMAELSRILAERIDAF